MFPPLFLPFGLRLIPVLSVLSHGGSEKKDAASTLLTLWRIRFDKILMNEALMCSEF